MSNIVATEQAYWLRHNLDHLVNATHSHDAYIVEFEGYRSYGTDFFHPDIFELPDHNLEFQGYDSILRETDFPYTNVRWPVMSKKMLNTLLSVQQFEFRCFEIPFAGFADNAPEVMLRQGLRDGVRYDDKFVAVQLGENLDIFDWEKSVYEMDDMFPKEVDRIRDLVLKVPEEGLPPIFRIAVDPVRLYVSPEAGVALEAADIKGIEFLSL